MTSAKDDQVGKLIEMLGNWLRAQNTREVHSYLLDLILMNSNNKSIINDQEWLKIKDLLISDETSNQKLGLELLKSQYSTALKNLFKKIIKSAAYQNCVRFIASLKQLTAHYLAIEKAQKQAEDNLREIKKKLRKMRQENVSLEVIHSYKKEIKETEEYIESWQQNGSLEDDVLELTKKIFEVLEVVINQVR